MSSRAGTTSRGRLFKSALFLAALGPLLFSNPAAAQEQRPSARKFDEFGDIDLSAIKARLDNFAIQIQHEPAKRGFLIVYRSRSNLPGLSNRRALWLRDYLLYNNSIPKERLVVVDGGPAECFMHELWVVDPGAAPKPREDAYSRTFFPTDSALKFDELYYPLRSDPRPDDVSASGVSTYELEGFAAALRQHPRARAYVIAYKQRNRDRRSDAPGVSRLMLRTVRGDLIREFGIAPARITVADGGYRFWRGVELWVMPPGARPPVATPNAYPPAR